MTENKQQKIIVPFSFTPADKNVVLNGIKIAGIFKKELCLLYNFKKKELHEKEDLKAKLQDYVFSIKGEMPSINISTLFISEKNSVLPGILADEFEAILVIAAASEFSGYSKSVRESPIPFLFVNENRNTIPEYKNVVLPLDFRPENKDTSLWASYFGRFNRATIAIVSATDKGKEEQMLVAKNALHARNIFRKFQIQYRIFKGIKSSFHNSFEALELAKSSNCDLLIILGSSSITPLDWLIGLPERKIIGQAANLPVLIINPKKDNYILCD